VIKGLHHIINYAHNYTRDLITRTCDKFFMT